MRSIGNYKVAETDYKAQSEDVLYALSEVFENDVPILISDEMKKLAKDYALEPTLDAIKAIGQEISTASHLLYSIEEDSDSYVLTIIPADEEETFLFYMKNMKRKTKCMLQPRKKPGSPAKRMDFGKRLNGTAIDLDSEFMIFEVDGDDGLYINHANPDHKEYGRTSIFGFDPQPSVIAVCPKIIKKLTHKDGKYAAIKFNPERKSFSSGLTDRKSYISVGAKLEDVSGWNEVAVIEYDSGFADSCVWFGEDLFVANPSKVYAIRNAMSSSPKKEMVFKNDKDKNGSDLFVMKDSLYLVMNGKILRWSEGGFLRKAGFNKCIYSGDPSTKGITSVLVLNDREVAFVEHQTFNRTEDVPMMDITILDVETAKTRKIHTFRGWIYTVRKGEIIVLCNSRANSKNDKKYPLMTIIDMESEQQKSLPFGCLGPAEIRGVYKTRDDRLLLHTDNKIILPDDLESFLK